MKLDYLQRLHAMDAEAFGALMRRLGFPTSALYLLQHGQLVQILVAARQEAGGEDLSNLWPAVVGYDPNYTASPANLPWGWVKAGTAGTERKHWPKGTNFYFPEQAVFDTRVVFAGLPAPGKRCRTGEVDGALEAAAARIRHLIEQDRVRAEASELGFVEHVRALGVDLEMLVNHELRTPLSSVSGYATLLEDLDRDSPLEEWREYSHIVFTQANYALEALEKLSLVLRDRRSEPEPSIETFDAAEVTRQLCVDIKCKAGDIVGEDAAQRTEIKFHKSSDRPCVISADPRLYRWAVWEVLKNAVIHARAGQVEVRVYTSDKMLVIDIWDDGEGVSEGAEELIFLRFYQDPATHVSRKGKRGLGLGLFLARHLAERHLGQLRYLRGLTKGGTFRFLWPLAEEEEMRLSKGA